MNAHVEMPVRLSLVDPSSRESIRHNSVKGIIRLANNEGRARAVAYLEEQEAKLEAMRHALQYDETLEAVSMYSSHLEQIEKAGDLGQETAIRECLVSLIDHLHSELTRLGELVPEMKDYAVNWG